MTSKWRKRSERQMEKVANKAQLPLVSISSGLVIGTGVSAIPLLDRRASAALSDVHPRVPSRRPVSGDVIADLRLLILRPAGSTRRVLVLPVPQFRSAP